MTADPRNVIVDSALVLAVAALQACGATTPDHTDAGTDVAFEAAPEAGTDADPDGLAHCFEIYTGAPTRADGGSVPDAGGLPHTNPLAYEFGGTTAADPLSATQRYYNFCGDPNPTIGTTDVEPASESASFTVSPPTPGPLPAQSMDVTWHVTFHPASVGDHRLTVRVHTNAGIYQTDFHGVGL